MIANKYQLLSKIGEGKFGKVYKGKDAKTGEFVAIKIECIVFDEPTEKMVTSLKLLKRETMMLHYLHGHHCRNVPLVYWYGSYENFPTLVMPFYANSLETFMNQYSVEKTPISIVFDIILSMVDILENIHSHFVIHRDIKPDNFMMTSTNKVKLVLIDFGLATVYVDDRQHHFPMKTERGRHIIGTPKYISTYVHDGTEPSRRDDLISVGYIGWLMLVGNLPWPSVVGPSVVGPSNQDKYNTNKDTIVYEKTHILHPKNQEYKKAKQEFLDNTVNISSMSEKEINHYSILLHFIKVVYHLEFTETPNYSALSQLLCRMK